MWLLCELRELSVMMERVELLEEVVMSELSVMMERVELLEEVVMMERVATVVTLE